MKTFLAIVAVAAIIAGGWWWTQHQDFFETIPLPTSEFTGNPSLYAYQDGYLLLGRDSTTTIGAYLIGFSGMPLYVFDRDAINISSCTGLCAKAWPPYTISSRDALLNTQAGIHGKVDAITRTDGSMQVTYDGQPLYFYASDKNPGDLLGDGVGGVWHAAKP